MKGRSPRRGDRHVKHICAHKTARILHALHRTLCGHCISVKRIAPTRLREYFTHCVQHSAFSSGRRKTHSAYKTVGILYALRQMRCGPRGAAAEVKIVKPH
ncbi:unnamed protein product, partial [Bemisia tabaci]